MPDSKSVQKAHIVLAHPEAKSFNAQLSGTSQQVLGAVGCITTLSDLYAMNFDPREGRITTALAKTRRLFMPKPSSVLMPTMKPRLRM